MNHHFLNLTSEVLFQLLCLIILGSAGPISISTDCRRPNSFSYWTIKWVPGPAHGHQSGKAGVLWSRPNDWINSSPRAGEVLDHQSYQFAHDVFSSLMTCLVHHRIVLMTCLVRSLNHGDSHCFNPNVNSTLHQSEIWSCINHLGKRIHSRLSILKSWANNGNMFWVLCLWINSR